MRNLTPEQRLRRTNNPPKATWHGISETAYRYLIYGIRRKPSPGKHGNYIFAKKVKGEWKAVYIGQGNLRDRHDDAMEEECVTENGATHYHVHSNTDKDARLKEEADLINGNPECWVENGGCNEVIPDVIP